MTKCHYLCSVQSDWLTHLITKVLMYYALQSIAEIVIAFWSAMLRPYFGKTKSNYDWFCWQIAGKWVTNDLIDFILLPIAELSSVHWTFPLNSISRWVMSGFWSAVLVKYCCPNASNSCNWKPVEWKGFRKWQLYFNDVAASCVS